MTLDDFANHILKGTPGITSSLLSLLFQDTQFLIQGSIHLIHLKDMFCSKSVIEVYPTKRKLLARVVLVNPENKVSWTLLLSFS